MVALRRICLVLLLMAAGACASGEAKPPLDGNGMPMERLVVRTATGDHDFWVEIADDDAERARGLMFRPPLDAGRGMLFQFPVSEEQGFWMRNTPSSLDIVYIDPRGRIVSVAAHTTPYSETTYPSYGAANGVLEVRAGRMEEIGAKVGDTVVHPFFVP